MNKVINVFQYDWNIQIHTINLIQKLSDEGFKVNVFVSNFASLKTIFGLFSFLVSAPLLHLSRCANLNSSVLAVSLREALDLE